VLDVVENSGDADIRAVLIAAARAQMGREDTSHFNIKSICAETGINRADFHRFFSGKEALIAAVLDEDVVQLQGIAVTAAEPRVALAVANGAPAPAPQSSDAWLERRLRVFERALAALEARQQKSEQLLNRSVALLEEKITRSGETPVFQPAEPEMAPKTTQRAEGPVVEIEATARPLHPLFLEPEPQPVVTPQEMEDLLANARRAAREAAEVTPPPPKPKRLPSWIAWAGAGGLVLIVVTALAVGSMMNASASADGNRHRQVAQPALARIVALADSGEARSQTRLALAYLRGEHLPPDPAAVLRWGLAAAKQGDPMAQYLVGTLYQQGSGVAADPRQAFEWFEAAALRGNLKAMHDLAIAYAEGRGTPKDATRAAAWFNRAAEQGYVDSQFDLAVLYERGDGVRQNPVAALKWYLVAAKAGDAQARDRANQLAGEMAGPDIARAQQIAARFAPASHDLIANNL
jgi:TPR repeat protein